MRSTLLMKRLALSVVRDHDPDAAQVLGDLVMETYGDEFIGGVETGRVRLVLFRIDVFNRELNRLLTRDELMFLTHPSARAMSGALFSVPVREVLYNTDHFAKLRDKKSWKELFTMWVTSQRDIYQAMIRQRVLPSSIKVRDLIWQGRWSTHTQAYQLFLKRVPKGRKKPQSLYLFTVARQDSPATREKHFRNLPRS